MTQLLIQQVRDGRHGVPSYETPGAVGFDLKAYLNTPRMAILPGERVLIPTGLAMAVPYGFEVQVRPRSGNSLKKGLGVLNSPGTIDQDFRGEVGVILINLSDHMVTINDGDRIAQGVLCPVYQADFVVVDQLNETKRGAGGFGSTDAQS